LAKSWAKLYGGYLGQELRVETELGGDGERFSVIGESIMRDPEGVSHTQALKELEARLKAAQPAQPKSLLDDVTGLATLVASLKAAFGGNSSSGGIIQLKEGSVSLADFLKIKQFQNDEQSKGKSDEVKLGIAKEFRELLGKAGKALGHMGEEEETGGE